MSNANAEDAEQQSRRPLGLSAEALRLYELLLERPLTRAEIRTACPHLDGDDLFAELNQARLVRTAGTSDTWVAVPPAVAAEELLRHQELAATQQLAQFALMRQDFALLAETTERPVGAAPPALAEIIETSEGTRERIAEISAMASESIWAAHPSLPSVESLEAGLPLVINAAARGLDIRGLYPHAARRHYRHALHLQTLVSHQCHVRTAPVIPFRAIIVDNAIAVIPRADGSEGAAILREPTAVTFVAQIFDALWSGAESHGFENSADDVVAAEIVTSILRELALGHTDETVARRLGISTRTMRRHLTKVTNEHGVYTRFQLGMVAQRHFGLSVDDSESAS